MSSAMVARSRLLFVLLAGCGVFGMLAAWLLWPRTEITRENAAKIQHGMTLADVELILGGPPRSEGNSGVFLAMSGPAPMDWESHDVLIQIWFGTDGRVIGVQAFPSENPEADVRRWLRL
jgi:hypothetical protein